MCGILITLGLGTGRREEHRRPLREENERAERVVLFAECCRKYERTAADTNFTLLKHTTKPISKTRYTFGFTNQTSSLGVKLCPCVRPSRQFSWSSASGPLLPATLVTYWRAPVSNGVASPGRENSPRGGRRGFVFFTPLAGVSWGSPSGPAHVPLSHLGNSVASSASSRASVSSCPEEFHRESRKEV